MKKLGNDRKQITLHIDPAVADRFDKACEDMNLTKGQAARSAIDLWLSTSAEDKFRILAHGSQGGIRSIVREILDDLKNK